MDSPLRMAFPSFQNSASFHLGLAPLPSGVPISGGTVASQRTTGLAATYVKDLSQLPTEVTKA